MNEQKIVLTEVELQKIIENAINTAIEKLQLKSDDKKTTALTLNEAIDFLNSIGYKCGISLMHKKTMANEIPHSKFGRRLFFNTLELTKWVQDQVTKKVK